MSLEDEDVVGYHPNVKPVETGQQCFLNMDRPCGADCMAFQTDRPAGAEYNGQWAHCSLLTNLHKGAKHLIILAGNSSTLVKQKQDEQRRNQSPPPIPTPGIPGVR